jgi:hypothetical protein
MNRRNFFAGLFGMAAVAVAPKAEAKRETGAERASRMIRERQQVFDKHLSADWSECPELPPFVQRIQMEVWHEQREHERAERLAAIMRDLISAVKKIRGAGGSLT